MIQSKEVRIGNLVEFNGEVFEIESISRDLPNIKLDSRGIGVVPWVSLNGVTLTEEWLVKFGFVQYGQKNEHNPMLLCKSNYDFAIYPPSDIFKKKYWRTSIHESIASYKDLNILFVHQLQNLYFALTGEELTLTPNETHNN